MRSGHKAEAQLGFPSVDRDLHHRALIGHD